MEVHADSSLEGKNQMGLTDINGKLIVKGLLQTAAHSPQGQGGWYHYQWYIPGGLFPRWKSSYVMPVVSVTGKKYIIGSGIYTDKMERGFVTDMVNGAIKQIETKGDSAFAMLHDKSGPFLAKDAYIFVLNMDSVELVNPAFPGLEGRNLKDIRDTEGKLLVADMFKVMNENGSGWVDYMWPKPGASVSSTKSTFVKKASYKGTDYLVGCGVYLADAVKSTQALNLITSTQLVSLVNEAADVFMQKGENAYPEFREKGGKWFRGDTYFFVWSTDGIRKLNVSNPSIEGRDVRDFKDVLGRPIGKMILEVGNSKAGEGWVHYIYPEPGSIFPIWKSSYVKRVTFPSGKQYIIGCGIYNMDLDKPMVENLISQAAALVEKDGKKALPLLRDPKGPFVFMDTYIFMVSPEGIELFNAAVPQLEGKNIIDAKDLKGNNLIRDEISLAMKNGQGWLDGYWYRPGDDKPALKHTFVKRIQFEGKPCVIGSGFYPPAE
jgi:signal transduction histidine kinase